MELVKDIYFNTDKLIENTKVKVSYTGKFYQSENEKVFIHYGYGENWNNLNEIEMNKTDLGYQTELNLAGGNTLNFCFKNQNNEWDNNCGKNYVFNIEKNTVNELGETTVGTKGNNLVFWGKTFGKNEENSTDPNLFWSSEEVQKSETFVNKVEENTSGVIEDVINNAPNSVDAVISNKASNAVNDDNCFKVITSSLDESPVANLGEVENVTAVNTPEVNIAKPIQNNFESNIKPETSIALAPTGFEYWTKRIKDTVCKFFEYVPKFISGNFKRDLSNNNK